MFRAALHFTTISVALLVSPPALGQDRPPSPPETSEIVVTGSRDVERQLRDFVGALAPAQTNRQMARFETAVCPAVLGLAPVQKAAIEQRLRSVAEAAGLKVARKDCGINVLLMVAEDKKAFIKSLQDDHPRYLGNLTLSDTRRLIRSPGPTASWQLTGIVNERGVPVGDGNSGDLGYLNRTSEPPSRITAATRPIFEASALVVERRALAGLTTTQFADYAAMRLFARIDPSRLEGISAPTIVTILEAPKDSEVPLSLTKWDLGFLRGLYTSEPNAAAGSQRSQITKQIGRDIASTDKER